jgi:hypothetical protein
MEDRINNPVIVIKTLKSFKCKVESKENSNLIILIVNAKPFTFYALSTQHIFFYSEAPTMTSSNTKE